MDIWTAITSVPMPVLVIILIAIIIVTLYATYQHAKLRGLDGIRAEVYQLILKAEHTYIRSGSGEQKLKYVVGKARGLLPGWMQFFVTEDMLMEIIDVWFQEIKDLLDDGKINESAKNE